MDERIDKLIESAASTGDAGVAGRSTDPRQDAYVPDLSKRFGDLAWTGWMLEINPDPDTQRRVSVPIDVVGHADLDASEWDTLLQRIHDAVHPKQVDAPVYGVEAASGRVPAHRLVEGEYLPVMRASFPESVEKLGMIGDIADRVLYHPMGHPHLNNLEGRTIFAGDLRDELITIADEKLVRPNNNADTMGDVLNRISHPFGTSSLY